MSSDKLRAFIKDVRTFCQQSAALLNLADSVLAEQGWETAQSQNIAFAYGSTAVTSPKKWFPTELFRFYKPSGGIDRIAFASLLLDDDPEGNYVLSVSVSALFDGALVALFDGSDSRSGALLGTMGSGIGNQLAITYPARSLRIRPSVTRAASAT